MPTNDTFDVQGYVDDEALPLLYNRLGFVRTLDRQYANWDKPEAFGTRGDQFLVKLPTRINADDGLTFDSTSATDGSFQERILSVTASEQANARYAITDTEQATFDVNGLLRSNPKSAVNELANKMDAFAAQGICNLGYRAFGDFQVQMGQNQTVGEVTQNVAVFQSFGCSGDTWYGMPLGVAARITQSSLQQFVLKRNEEVAVKGELGELGGVPDTTFLTSNLLPIHTSGTAADNTTNFSTGYGITGFTVTDPSNDITTGTQSGSTTITLSGGTNGDTIFLHDFIDIGFLNTSNPLRYLTFTGYHVSENTIQARVITGDTFDGSGNATIVVKPALIHDGTSTDVNRNMNRAVIFGDDTVRVAKSHRCGVIYEGSYGKFVCPRLPTKEPYPSASKMEKETQLSIRVYYGATALGLETKYFVHDTIYGFGGSAEAFGVVLLPL